MQTENKPHHFVCSDSKTFYIMFKYDAHANNRTYNGEGRRAGGDAFCNNEEKVSDMKSYLDSVTLRHIHLIHWV